MTTAFSVLRVAPDRMSLVFADNPIPFYAYANYRRVCQNNISFEDVASEKLRTMMMQAGVDGVIDIAQAQSIYTFVVKEHNYHISSRIVAELPVLIQEYDAGANILEIAAKKGRMYSPYRVIRDILETKYPNIRKTLNAIAHGKLQAGDVMNARDAAQLTEASAHDYESVGSELRSAMVSQTHEDAFVSILRDELGLKIKTQNELIAEQSPITPDILFLEPVYVNGKPCHWIDFKSYCGAPIKFMETHQAQQSAKYTLKFGPGLFCFVHGYVESLGTKRGKEYKCVSGRGLRDKIYELANGKSRADI